MARKKISSLVKKGIANFRDEYPLDAETKKEETPAPEPEKTEIAENPPVIEVVNSGYITWKKKNKNGQPILSKSPPLHIVDFIKTYRSSKNFTDNQLKVLVDILGLNPEEWDRKYKLIVTAIGQGGGKNYIFETLVNYQTWYISNLINPYEFFDTYRETLMNPTDDFEFTNSSMVNKEQATEVFFSRIKKELRATKMEGEENWYQKYMGMDMREKGLGDIRKQIIEFPTFPTLINAGRIRLHSLDSKKESLEGKKIITAIGDELSRAETKPEFKQVQGLVNVALGNATVTRFPGGVGKVIVFSYYNNTDWDITYKLIKDEKDHRLKLSKTTGKPLNSIKTNTYILEKSSYDMNPEVKREHNEDMYRLDRDDAECRFESIKHKSRSKFLGEYVYKMEECINNNIKPKVTYELEVKTNTLGKLATSVDLKSLIIKGDRKERVFAADPGKSKDSFVITGSYAETIKPEDVFEHKLMLNNQPVEIKIDRKIVTDIIIEYIPTREAPVDYINVGQVIGLLLDKYPNTRCFNFDRFNSEKFIQEIQSRGVNSKAYTFSRSNQYKLYMLWRVGIINNLYEYMYHMTLLTEGEELIREGDKIDHPPGGSKDITDCVIMNYYDLTNSEYQGTFNVDGLEKITDERLFVLAEKYILEKFKAVHNDVEDIPAHIINTLNLKDYEQYVKLKSFVEQTYPQHT
jgi:hypothetical protein